MATYRGYTGKNTQLLKLLGSASDTYAKAKKDEEEKRQEQALLDAEKQAAVEEKKNNPSFLEGVGGFLTDAGRNIAAGTQQTAGKVADVAIKGGGVLDEIANQIQGGTEEEKDKRRIRNIANSESLRNVLKGQKDITGQNIEGSKDISVEDIQRDPRKLAELAGEGLDVGLGATMFANPVSTGARGAASATGRSVLKDAAKSASLFGGLDTASGTLKSVGEGDDLGTAVGKGLQEGAVSAVTQGALDAAGGAIGRRIGKSGRDAAQAAKDAEAKAAREADDARIAQIAQDEKDAAATLARPFKDTPDEELAKNIEAFQNGERPNGDVGSDYSRYQKMVDEVSTRENEAARNSFENNGLPNDVKGAQDLVDNFDNRTNLPDNVYKPAAPIESAAQALVRDDIPVEIKNAAQEVVHDRKVVEDQLFTLMSPEKYDAEISRLDAQYDADLQALTQRYSSLEKPTRGKDTTVDQTVDGQRLSGDYQKDIRFSVAKDKLDEQYRNDVAELDMLKAQDAPDVEQLQKIQDTLARRDMQITRDVNQMMEASPDSFRDIDKAEFDAQRQAAVDNLDQAKRFNEPERVIEEVAASPNPEATFDTNPQAEPAFETDLNKNIGEMETNPKITENFKNLNGVKASAIRIMSPSQVLEKWGLRGPEIDVHTGILRAESALNAANKADSEVLQRINEILPSSPESQRQIVEYLEGTRKTLSSMDEESATMIRNFLDEKKAGLEKMGFKTLEDYFPHMFDPKDPEVKRLFKGKVNTDIKFGNIKQRLTDSDNYSRDIMEVLTQYTSSYNRKTILEPALKPLDDIRTQVNLQDAEAKWLDEYITQLKGFDNSKIGDSYNTFIDSVLEKMGKTNAIGQNHAAQHLGTQRMVSAMATMGLNPGAAIRNMTQMVNTVADIGPRYSTLGMWDGLKALRAGPGSAEWKELQRAGIMEGGVSQNYFDAITKPGVHGRIAQSRDKAVKGMMSLIRGTDVLLRTQAYYGAKALAAKKGLVGKAAEDFAIRKVVDTQFITSRVDMPVAFNSQGVRSLTQLATFSGKQAGFLKRMGVRAIKNADGNYQIDVKQMGSLLAAVSTAALATEALKPLLGFKETEWIPFYDQVAPLYGAITGQDVGGGDGIYRSPLVTLLAGDGKSKAGLIQALQGQDVNGDKQKTIGEGFEKFLTDQWSSIIPGGTQLKKTLEGYNTTTSGESRNAKGNLRYLQDMDMDSQLKASLFGQYSTEAGQNWINSGFPTLSEKQTQEVDKHPSRKVKEQYTDYYVAKQGVSGRQDAYDEIKAAAKAGDINKVARLSKEYNDTVTKAMGQYWSKHEDMPKDLRDDANSLYIDPKNVLKSAKEDK